MSVERTDVVVIGGGPAGLAAALVLARACLKVWVVDGGTPRNASATRMHGFLGHEGQTPADFREAGKRTLEGYGVTFAHVRASELSRGATETTVRLEDGRSIEARRVLLAVGLVDLLPKLPGLKEAWGTSAFSCPHCHGYEHREKRWGLLALQKSIARMAPLYLRWTPSVTLLLNGRTDLDPELLTALEKRGVTLEPRALTGLTTDGARLLSASFGDDALPLDALVLHPAQRQTDLVLYAGLTLDADGWVKVDEQHQTSFPGVLAAGDLTGASARALDAAADGAAAAVAIVERWDR